MTFRGKGGIWNTFDPDEVASIQAWQCGRYSDCKERRQKALDFFNPLRRLILAHEPNEAHRLIAMLQQDNDVTVITQNGDDFHTRAGSADVIYLHGEALKNCSVKNPTVGWDIDRDNPDILIGDKAPDGSQIRPFVIYFGENISRGLWSRAVGATKCADYFVVVGSTMLVHPACDLLGKLKADCKIFLIDPEIQKLPDSCNRDFTQFRCGATEGMHRFIEKLGEL